MEVQNNNNLEFSVKEQLQEALKRFEISQNKAAKELGYTSSVLSQYLNGTYNGDIQKVEEAIITWIARKTESARKKHVPVIETETMKQISRAIRLAHDERDIALIVSDAGGGKTTAAQKYAEDNPRTCVLVRCYAGTNKRILTQEIARKLGLQVQRVGFDRLVDQITDILRERDMVVILDEADSLRDDALEFCRRLINDLGETGLILIGLPTFVYRIQNLKSDHRQLESRIGVFLSLPGLSKADAKRLAESVWENCPQEVIDSIYQISKQDTRQFVKIINRAQNVMLANGVDVPDVEVAELAGSMVFKRAAF